MKRVVLFLLTDMAVFSSHPPVESRIAALQLGI
mgnify:CR=1 FL=1